MSGITLIISSLMSLIELDIKKTIALSTLNQISVIITLLWFTSEVIIIVYIVGHAFIKRAIFMTAGIIIHNSKSYQDVRIIAFNLNNNKLTSLIIFICIIMLQGILATLIFQSKHTIIIRVIEENTIIRFIIRTIIYLFIAYTVFYTFRILFITKITNSIFIWSSNRITDEFAKALIMTIIIIRVIVITLIDSVIIINRGLHYNTNFINYTFNLILALILIVLIIKFRINKLKLVSILITLFFTNLIKFKYLRLKLRSQMLAIENCLNKFLFSIDNIK